jgi:hypothetical protein
MLATPSVHPVAVELYFVQPLRAVRRLIDKLSVAA